MCYMWGLTSSVLSVSGEPSVDSSMAKVQGSSLIMSSSIASLTKSSDTREIHLLYTESFICKYVFNESITYAASHLQNANYIHVFWRKLLDIKGLRRQVIQYSSRKTIKLINDIRIREFLDYTYQDQWRHLCLASLPSHSAGHPCLGLCSAAWSSCDLPGLLRPPGSLSAALQGTGQGQSEPGWAGSSWDWAQHQYHCPGDWDIQEGCYFQPQCCCRQKYRYHCPTENERDRCLPFCPLHLTSWTGSPQCPFLSASERKKKLCYNPQPMCFK